MRLSVLLAACLAFSPAFADEGMWTFDGFPAARVKQLYGAELSANWRDRVRLASVRLTNCSASFVSAQGLIITNHHCMEPCLAALSTKDKNLLATGFLAPNRADEQPCVAQHADVLVATEEITDAVRRAVKGLGDVAANVMRKKTLLSLAQTCEEANTHSKSDRLHCQTVTLYDGGQYFLYKYKRYDDLRLVFAPESDIGAFGGDADNFEFPRWTFDVAILRAYQNDMPARTPAFLPINFAGPAANQLVLVAGNPGSTDRFKTRAELRFERDVVLPVTLLRAAELRGRYIQFGKTNPANQDIIDAPLNALQNIIKVRRYQLAALDDDALMARRSAEEATLKAQASLAGTDPWHTIETAVARQRQLYLPLTYIENGAGFSSMLFRDARILVRGTHELQKPSRERLREYADGALPALERDLFARVPVIAEFEALTLAFSLEGMRGWLGADNAVVRRLLRNETPDTLAVRLVAETKLDDAAVRQALWKGGKTAVDASRDPMIELVRSVEVDSHTLRDLYESEVEAPIAAAAERIAAIRVAAGAAEAYPDATFTLRLNYGSVQGWIENGAVIEPFTRLEGAFARAGGVAPFSMPDSWIKAHDRLDMNTPFCLSTNNDIVGGSSGSAVIDAAGQFVGLMFDGNAHSVAGHYAFDAADNRAVALHPAIIREALDKVYGAKALLKELGAK